MRRRPFVGFDNHLAHRGDQAALTARANTTIIAFGIGLLCVPAALLIANLLAKPRRLAALYETAYFLPVVASMVPATSLREWILGAQLGQLNQFLGVSGVAPQAWLIKLKLAIFSVISLSARKVLRCSMMIFVVGMLNIPQSWCEAAEIYGANASQRRCFITLPLFRPISLAIRASWWRTLSSEAIVLIGAIPVVTLFVWMLSTAVKSPAEILQWPPSLIPNDLSFANSLFVFHNAPFGRGPLNLLMLAVASTVAIHVISALAGYVLAKFTFPVRGPLYLVILATAIVPFV